MNITDLYILYTKSPSYRGLSESSKKTHAKAIRSIRLRLTQDITDITRTDILLMRDGMSQKPGLANISLALTSILLNFAVDYGYLTESPYRNIKKLQGGTHTPWSKHDLDLIPKIESERARRTILMALYTGQRLCDVAAVRWSDIDKAFMFVELVQQKTGQRVYIPLPEKLKTHLRKWAKTRHGRDEFICAMDTKVSVNGLRERVRWHIRRVGIKGTIHGLRYTSLTRLAEAGCSDREIMAISGHRTVRMVSKYTKYVSQKSMAESAIRRLNNAEG